MPVRDFVVIDILSYFTRFRFLRKRSCSSSYDSDACVNLVMGFAGLFVWPAVILATLSAAMDIWGAVNEFLHALRSIESTL